MFYPAFSMLNVFLYFGSAILGKRNNNKKASPVYRNHHQFKEEIDKQQNLDKLF